MFKVVNKLKRTKIALKDRNKSTFQNFPGKMALNSDTLQYIEDRLMNDPHSHRLNQWYQRMSRQQERLLLFHQCYWGKYHRKKWLAEEFQVFPPVAKFRKQKNTIIKLQDMSAVWIDDQAAIQNKFIQDFSIRFSSQRQMACVRISIAPILIYYAIQGDSLQQSYFRLKRHSCQGACHSINLFLSQAFD